MFFLICCESITHCVLDTLLRVILLVLAIKLIYKVIREIRESYRNIGQPDYPRKKLPQQEATQNDKRKNSKTKISEDSQPLLLSKTKESKRGNSSDEIERANDNDSSKATVDEDSAIHRTVNVLIVGAGPSGLAMGGALRAQGVKDVLLVEKSDKVAPSWNNHYERLHLHTHKMVSSLPYVEWPDHFPTFPSRKDVVAYMESYSKIMQLDIAFHQLVTSSTYDEDQGNGTWTVTAWNEKESQTTIYKSNYLIICSGEYEHTTPNHPIFENQDQFQGTIIHSNQYKNGMPYAGKKVLVVGFGNSGCEIAVDLWEHGAKPSLVVRRPVTVLPREMLQTLTVPMYLWGLRHLPLSLQDAMLGIQTRMAVGDLSPYGIQHPHPKYGIVSGIRNHGFVPLIDVGTIELIKKREITLYNSNIREFTRNGAIFEDGREAEFDSVILATGYKSNFQQFLPKSILNSVITPKGGKLNIAEDQEVASGFPFNRTLSGKEIQRKGLYFVGFVDQAGKLWEIRLEAIRVAKEIAKKEKKI